MGKHSEKSRNEQRKRRKLRKRERKKSILNRGNTVCNAPLDYCTSSSAYVASISDIQALDIHIKPEQEIQELCLEEQISVKAKILPNSQTIDNTKVTKDKVDVNIPRKRLPIHNDPLLIHYREYLLLQKRLHHIKEGSHMNLM